MALGFCSTCGKLTTVVPRTSKVGERRPEWYPVSHEMTDKQGMSQKCDGEYKAII